MAGDSYPDTAALERDAKHLLAKFARAEKAGDAGELEAIRVEMRVCHGALQPIFDGIRASEAIKAAHRRPMSLFKSSPGAG